MIATSELETSELTALHTLMSKYLLEKSCNAFELLINEKVNYRIRKINTINFSEIEDLVPPLDERTSVYAVYVQCEGDIHLELLFSFHESDAKNISSKLLNKKINRMTKLSKSTLTEVGNILSASLFNTISNSKNYKINATVPGFANETYRSLLVTLVLNFAETSEKIVTVDIEFFTESSIVFNVLIMLDPSETRKLLQSEYVAL